MKSGININSYRNHDKATYHDKKTFYFSMTICIQIFQVPCLTNKFMRKLKQRSIAVHNTKREVLVKIVKLKFKNIQNKIQ